MSIRWMKVLSGILSKIPYRISTFAFIILALSVVLGSTSLAAVNAIEITRKTAENHIRHLVEPLLDKYCKEECKLMNINVTVDLAISEEVTPGFDDAQLKSSQDLAPASAQIKLLMDDKVGPVSRGKLLDLIQQYLDTLEYPVKIDTQIAHFPLPQGSEGKVAELRERVSKEFLSITNDLIRQFCQQRCILADFDLQTEVVNGEEAQYGSRGEFVQEGDTAIRIRNITATVLMDESLTPEEQVNIVEMVRLKTNLFKHVNITGKSMKFPRPDLVGTGILSGMDGRSLASQSEKKTSSDTKSNSSTNSNNTNNSNNSTSTKANNSESNSKQENSQRIERIERVESGDAVQAELQKFKVFGLIFACMILALLLFIAMAAFRSTAPAPRSTVHRVFEGLTSDPATTGSTNGKAEGSNGREERTGGISRRYECERLYEELLSIFSQQPRVAKQVFGRILTEEGVEVTAECIHVFGEGIVVDLLRDPSLQADLNELMDYYAKNPIELNDDQKLDLLRKLHSRTVAGKLVVMGNRSSNLFDFLGEMDGLQILELIRTESLTVKAIVLTQVDHQKRSAIYAQMDADVRMQLLAELSRIDYLPRDYIFNVANALKRKRRDNPKLNTEALPGSDVLVGLLEKTGHGIQKTIIKNLEVTNPDSARTVKGKLVSLDTLHYLRDGQLLEVILSLKHDELIQFLKGAPDDIRKVIFSKSPRDLVIELEEELAHATVLSRETYQTVERKIINRMKVLANDGHINLVETNERMFSDSEDAAFSGKGPNGNGNGMQIKKVAGW